MANSKHKTKSKADNMPKGALPTREEMENPAIREIDFLRLQYGPTPKEVFQTDKLTIRKLKALIRSRKTPDAIRIKAAKALNSYLDRHYKANDAFPSDKLEIEVKKLIEL